MKQFLNSCLITLSLLGLSDKNQVLGAKSSNEERPKTIFFQSNPKFQGGFPMIHNTGNSCAFDALLQVMLIYEMPVPERVQAFNEDYQRKACEVELSHMKLPSDFIVKYQRDHIAHFKGSVNGRKSKRTSSMADADEILITLWNEIPENEKLGPHGILYPFKWEWAVHLGNKRAHSHENGFVRTIHLNSFINLSKRMRLQGHKANLNDFLLHIAEDNGENVMLRLEGGITQQLVKSWSYTRIPQRQVFHIVRQYPAGVDLNISFKLDHPYNSELVAVVCYAEITRGEHYYAIIREENEEYEEGIHDPKERYLWVLYDGIRECSEVLPLDDAIKIMNETARLLFYEQKLSNDDVYDMAGLEETGKNENLLYEENFEKEWNGAEYIDIQDQPPVDHYSFALIHLQNLHDRLYEIAEKASLASHSDIFYPLNSYHQNQPNGFQQTTYSKTPTHRADNPSYDFIEQDYKDYKKDLELAMDLSLLDY